METNVESIQQNGMQIYVSGNIRINNSKSEVLGIVYPNSKFQNADLGSIQFC